MEEIVIVAAKRSAIAKLGGSFKDKSALDLLNEVGEEILKGIPKDKIDQVLIGNVIQAGNGQNLARQLSLKLNLNFDTMATTVNAVCGSGMQAILLGIQSLRLFDSNICIVGGVESMSTAPYLLTNYRFGKKYGQDVIVDSIQNDGLFDLIANMDMIQTAENIAKKYQITKHEQDIFALNSHLKASKALEENRFENEIVEINGIKEDEFIRHNATIESISRIKPIHHSVSAANSSGLSDGCALLVLMRKSDCIKYGLTPLAIVKNYVTSGCDNQYMGLSPIYAVRKLLEKTNTKIEDYDLVEMTEAFAAQSIAVKKELNIQDSQLNINGGALALGHPLGASGARIVVSAVHELLRTDKKTALATLCIGGGNSIAMSIEKYEEM